MALNKDSVRDPLVNQWGCERLNMFFTLSFKTEKKKKKKKKKKKLAPYKKKKKKKNLFGMRRRLICNRKFGKGV